jgi:chaperonin GroEL
LEKINQSRQKLGVRVVMRAIEEPLRQIANNAGSEGSVVIDKVKNGEGAIGYNADKRHL